MADEKEYVDVARLDVITYTRPDGSTDYQNGFEDGVSFILDKVDNLPREKVAPIVHAHWCFTEYEYFTCSVCDKSYYNGCESSAEARSRLENGDVFDFCPHCGAKMDYYKKLTGADDETKEG